MSQEWVHRDPSWDFSHLALAMNNHPMTQLTSHPKSIPWGKFIKIGGAPLPLLWAKGLSRCSLWKRGQACCDQRKMWAGVGIRATLGLPSSVSGRLARAHFK